MDLAKEINEQDAEYVNDFTAYESYVEYRAWIETSAHGFKVQLTLPSREHLKAFDGVMTRRKGKAGHRYQIVVSGDKVDTKRFETQFWGRGWSEQKGTHIALHFAGSDVMWWKQQRTKDQGEAEERGDRFYVILLEVGDDERIINQRHLREAEARAYAGMERGVAQEVAEASGKPLKGGPKSQNAARMLREDDFLMWLNHASRYREYGPFSTYADAHELVITTLQMDSFKQFDVNEFFWGQFQQLFKVPYMGWLGTDA